MAKCDYCGSTIIFGGKRDGERRFCNDKCLSNGIVFRVADQIPPEILAEHVVSVHQGDCPRCGKTGPVDIHVHHSVWSALLLTSWGSHPTICCRSCGTKRKLGGILSSLFLGWWGIPWGLVITPIQIVRNFVGLFTGPKPDAPSSKLQNIIKADLATQILREQQNSGQQET